tara:strand:+ start:245 stop:580 length:336 start_codon:yes stop_codon:yes gene_type:complete
MKQALIHNTRILEFVSLAKERFPVHEALIWVGVPNNTTTEDMYVGGEVVKFIPPEVPYNVLRRNAYPPIGDQLDAIWKQLNQDRLGGKSLIQEVDDQLNKVLAVKAAHPKP